jgi:type IV secretion system protein VirB6
MVLNAVVLTWFAFFALGLSAYMGAAMFKAIADGGGFLGSTFNVLGEATRYCVLMILMAIICFQAPSLASALTGGAAIQQGIQMIQNAMMVSGLRSASSARSASAATSAGGVIRAGAGLPHTAASMARRGYGAARSAAYKLAAQRGRS